MKQVQHDTSNNGFIQKKSHVTLNLFQGLSTKGKRNKKIDS